MWSRVTPLRFPLSVRNSICCEVDVIQDFEVESGWSSEQPQQYWFLLDTWGDGCNG